jgi:hypothetical protein
VEAIANVVVGYALAVVAQIVVFAWFGRHPSLRENLTLGGLECPHRVVQLEC